MKKLIVSLIFLFLLIGAFNINIEKQKKFPYIKDNKLYTEFLIIPISKIFNIEIKNNSIKYVNIYYSLNKYDGGIYSINYETYLKLIKDFNGNN